jgi:hypothetical protein
MLVDFLRICLVSIGDRIIQAGLRDIVDRNRRIDLNLFQSRLPFVQTRMPTRLSDRVRLLVAITETL